MKLKIGQRVEILDRELRHYTPPWVGWFLGRSSRGWSLVRAATYTALVMTHFLRPVAAKPAKKRKVRR